ncbi:MAB_1171c family putative transporter [Motilibacter aurantiacus]|uniref:MAB_1171c family putative transporter n=1 Tax=Motilibacter aurantiacus TaxID=2714955 RepID=UPI00140871AA|nr:MAB_1171c family putative transporter [Motilibacter aurantiacus]NHC47143.1 hypothetical protein [Motilibacter aurantiacus]
MLALELVPPAIVWVAATYKLAALRRAPSTPAGRALPGMLVCLALASTAYCPPMYRWLGDATDTPNVAALIAQALGLAMIWPARNLLLYQRHASEVALRLARRRYVALPPILALQAVVWAWANTTVNDPKYVYVAAEHPRYVAFCAIHHAALVVAALDAIGPARRFGDAMSHDARVGMRLVAGAGYGALVLVGFDALFYASAFVGTPLTLWGQTDLVMAMNLHTSTTLLAVGATLPDWGPRLLRTLRAARALRALRPLWCDLVAAAPGVVPPRSHRVLDVQRRLHRRVTEIRDAELALRGYLPDESRLWQLVQRAGVPAEDAAAFHHAAALSAAATARVQCLVVRATALAPRAVEGGADLWSEADWLSAVARQYGAAKAALALPVTEPGDVGVARVR